MWWNKEESSEKSRLASEILLDTVIYTDTSAESGNKEPVFNFEIQLPSKSEFCINWKQKDYPRKLDSAFSNRQWYFDEVLKWVDDGGSGTIVNGEETGKSISRGEFERELSNLGLSLEELAGIYYPMALKAGNAGFKARPWHS